MLKDHVRDPKKQSEHISGFRQYLTYHIHACKTYMHMRMRKRVSSLLGALKLAVPEKLDEKIFKRARATKTLKEEAKIQYNF